MCDENTTRDAEEFLREQGLTRREFGKTGVGFAVSMLLPAVAKALDVVENEVLVETPDGPAGCYFVHPAEGAHAGVILWPDAMGIRPAFKMMGKRLAESGYSVLVVNLYFRTAEGRVLPEGAWWSDPGIGEMLQTHSSELSPETCLSDGRSFIDFLDSQASVDTNRKIGTMGYCMTGSFTMRLAAEYPERIGAGASFHGGRLVTDSDDSPHLLAPQIEAGLLIAIAESDDKRDPEAKRRLRTAFDAAGVDAEVEVYEGTIHGWCPLNSRVYHEAQAERAWNRLLALFESNLNS